MTRIGKIRLTHDQMRKLARAMPRNYFAVIENGQLEWARFVFAGQSFESGVCSFHFART